MAIQADAPLSGLLSFDKFSSLVEALREDIGRSANSDQRRRLFLVPNISVRTLVTAIFFVSAVRTTGGVQ